MPYDPFDPLAQLDQQMQHGSADPLTEYEHQLNNALGISNRQPPKFPPLPAGEQKTALDNILDTSIGGLQYIGETLDKPGRAVRGLLAGKPEELANLIPFSDTLGITDKKGWFGDTPLNVTDASQNVSGRDLLEKAGILDPNQPGLDWGDAAGFVADVALDPLTYVGIGPLTQAGKTAQAGGKLIKGVSRFGEAVKAGQKGLLGLELPFTGLSYVPEVMKGATAQKIAGGIQDAAKWTKATKPVALARGLFDHTAGGVFDPLAQDVAGIASELRPASVARGNAKFVEHFRDLAELQKAYSGELGDLFKNARGVDPTGEQLTDIANRWVQLTGETGDAGKAIQEVLSPAGADLLPVSPSPKLSQAVSDLAGRMKGTDDELFSSIIAKGGRATAMAEGDGIQHFPRFGSKWEDEAATVGARRINPVTSGSMKARGDEIRFIPGELVNKMAKDPRIMDDAANALMPREALLKYYGPNIGKAAQMTEIAAEDIPGIAARYADWVTKQSASVASQSMTAEQIAHELATVAGRGQSSPLKEWAVADQLAGYLGGKQGAFKKGRDILDTNAMNNWMKAQKSNRIVDASLDANHQFLFDHLGTGNVSVSDAFKQAGMNPEKATAYFIDKFGPQAATQGVSPEVASAMKALLAPSESPAWFKEIGRNIDKWTSFLKENLYLPFPSSWNRNFFGGQYNNIAMSGLVKSPKDLAAYGAEVKGFYKHLKNPAKVDEYVIQGLLDPQRGAGVEETLRGVSPAAIPGDVPMNPFRPMNSARAAKEVWQQSGEKIAAMTPDQHILPEMIRDLPGVKQVRQGYHSVMEAGGRATQQVELANRIPMYEYLRNHLGFTPEAAAAKVKELQFDMRELAPFEKDVMRRLVPFYSFSRKIMPLMGSNILQRPGGAVAQTIRASNMGRNNADFVPPYVGEGMSIELPGNSGAFLSQLGLPTDQLGELMAFEPTAFGTIKRTGQKLLSMTNPLLVKGPAEMISGVNMFTGQPYEDLYRYPTKNVLANAVLGESPLSRYITTTRQLTDDRKDFTQKAINTLTGVKITQPSGGRERQIELAARKVMNKVLKENPQIRSRPEFYLAPDEVPTDETKRLLRIKAGLDKSAKEAAKKERKVKKLQPVDSVLP